MDDWYSLLTELERKMWKMVSPYKYNIVIDRSDGICNLYFGCMTPYFDSEKLIFYTYNEELKQFEENTIMMNDIIAFSLTKVE